MADTLLTPKSADAIRGASTLFIHITNGRGYVRAEGYVVLKFSPDQFDQVVADVRSLDWYPRPIRSYNSGDYSMCERYPDPNAPAEEPAAEETTAETVDA